MRCEEYREAVLADALEGGEAGGHAQECAECAAFLTRAREVASRLGELPRHAPPPRVWREIAGQVRQVRRARRSGLLGTAITGLAAAILLVVLLGSILRPVPPMPEAKPLEARKAPPATEPMLAQVTDAQAFLPFADPD